MAADIVDISGRPMTAPGEPLQANERLVEFLADQLERAKAGQIIGFAGATFSADHHSAYWIAGTCGSFGMVGALDCAKRHVAKIAMGD